VAGQFLLLNPAVALLAGAGTLQAWRRRAFDSLPLMAAATSAPFIAYLLIHSLHDRVEAHWPAPLYPAAGLLAAYAAQGALGWRKRAARIVPMGIALTAIALAYMSLPQGFLPRGDPADPLRGWPIFTAQVDGVRAASDAAWVGALSYGVNGQLQAEGGISAPVLQLNERNRYMDMPPAPADMTKPGLVVDLMRRVDPAKLKACFAQVGPVVEIDRGPARDPDDRYAAVPVAGARPGLLARGCGG
jgi:hypothetical protein